MIKGQVWIKAERKHDDQSKIGETVSVLITDPDNSEKVFFKAGPYTIPNGQYVTHEKLICEFDLS